jgi:hypothetical protein
MSRFPIFALVIAALTAMCCCSSCSAPQRAGEKAFLACEASAVPHTIAVLSDPSKSVQQKLVELTPEQVACAAQFVQAEARERAIEHPPDAK